MSIPANQMIDFQLVVVGTFAPVGGESQVVNNVMTYKRTTVVSPHNNADFITAWRALVEGDWLDTVSESYNMDTLRIRCLNDAEDAYAETTVNSPGTIIGQALPGFNAMVISRRSAIRGRWAQGRSFIAGIPESGSDGNVLSSGQLALLAALAVLFNTPVVTAGSANSYVPSIFSQTYSQVKVNPTTVTSTEQASVVAQPVIGRMSSRRSRVA